MKPARKRRLFWVLGILLGVGIAGALALRAFRQNVMFFFDPTQVAQQQPAPGKRFRLGGMVQVGSVKRAPGSLQVRFVVTDFKHEVPVSYEGVLPDLFRENQGVIAAGRLDADRVFIADEVLAKHDEKYMPPRLEKTIKNNQASSGASAAAANDTANPQG
ncbi:MAG: cytochrome c maturation protein CcmE [Steroidobacteraceae bacterium]